MSEKCLTFPVMTAIVPSNFDAPDTLLSELGCYPDRKVHEFSMHIWDRESRRIQCFTEDGNNTPWMLANPKENWSVVFHSNEPIWGTGYWINYKPEGLLDYLRAHADNYELIYLNNGEPMFKFSAIQYICPLTNKWFVNITTIWINEALAKASQELLDAKLILTFVPFVFMNHDHCSICMESAYLERWQTCNHSFCSECTKEWRQNSYTCPMCRAVWMPN